MPYQTTQQLYWDILPISDEEFQLPVHAKRYWKGGSILDVLEWDDLEIDVEDVEIATANAIDLDLFDAEIELETIEALSGHWLEDEEYGIDLHEHVISIDTNALIDTLELQIDLIDTVLAYGTVSDLELLELEIDDSDCSFSFSINASLDEIDLEIDFEEIEPIQINIAAVLDDLLIGEIELEDIFAGVNTGFTSITLDAEIDLIDISLVYGTNVTDEEFVIEFDSDPISELVYGTELNSDCESMLELNGPHIHEKVIIDRSEANYIHTSHSQSSIIFMGTFDSDGYNDFKVRIHAAPYKRGLSCMVIHIGPVRPDMVVINTDMSLSPGPSTNMGAGEWEYNSLDQYLKIVNIDPIDFAVTQDGDTAELRISSGKNVPIIVFTDIEDSELL